MPRITALHMLRSIISTISAPEVSSFRGSLPHPTQPLCMLRVRRRRRLTQHSLPGGSLGLTWAGLAPADRASFAWRLPSLDHLVGAGEQRRRHLEAERLRGIQIHNKIELGRLLDRQVGRLLVSDEGSVRRTPRLKGSSCDAVRAATSGLRRQTHARRGFT